MFVIIASLLRCVLSIKDATKVDVSTIWAIRETVRCQDLCYAFDPRQVANMDCFAVCGHHFRQRADIRTVDYQEMHKHGPQHIFQ